MLKLVTCVEHTGIINEGMMKLDLSVIIALIPVMPVICAVVIIITGEHTDIHFVMVLKGDHLAESRRIFITEQLFKAFVIIHTDTYGVRLLGQFQGGITFTTKTAKRRTIPLKICV